MLQIGVVLKYISVNKKQITFFLWYIQWFIVLVHQIVLRNELIQHVTVLLLFYLSMQIEAYVWIIWSWCKCSIRSQESVIPSASFQFKISMLLMNFESQYTWLLCTLKQFLRNIQ